MLDFEANKSKKKFKKTQENTSKKKKNKLALQSVYHEERSFRRASARFAPVRLLGFDRDVYHFERPEPHILLPFEEFSFGNAQTFV